MNRQFEGKNGEVIQQQNRLLVLRTIRERQIISRVLLAEKTGLKQATITNIVNDLMAMNYVVEAGMINGKNGRRVKGLRLNNEKILILVFRLTSEYYAVGSYDLYGQCIEVEKLYWKADALFEDKLRTAAETAVKYKAGLDPDQKYLGIGIVTQDGVYPSGQEVNHEGSEARLIRYMEEKTDLPVFTENYSNMSGFYEWSRLGREKAETHLLLCLMIGYSIDFALIHDGNIILRKNGRVNHFGHVSIDYNGRACSCGNNGCIKNYISVGAVKKRMSELKDIYPESALTGRENIRDIIRAFREGDILAKVVYYEVAEKLGVILANLINQFCPDEIVIGDEIPVNDEFEHMVRACTAEHVPAERFSYCRIRFFNEERKTSNDVGLKGMCLYTVEQLFRTLEFR